MLRVYFKDSHGALVFWGPGNPSSLDGVPKWMTEINKVCLSIPCVVITLGSLRIRRLLDDDAVGLRDMFTAHAYLGTCRRRGHSGKMRGISLTQNR